MAIFLISHKARLSSDSFRTGGRLEHRLLFTLSPPAHTKHSSPPTSTRARSLAHTHPLPLPTLPPPPPDPTRYMSENEDAMKYKQGAGPDRRSHSPCETTQESSELSHTQNKNVEAAYLTSNETSHVLG